MIFARLLLLLIFAGALATAPAHAAAMPGTTPIAQIVARDRENQRDQDEDYRQSQARARGIITGSVVGVDYAHGVLRLVSGRGIYDIIVLPGTSILRPGAQYGTIADLTPGTRVAIYVSQVGGRLMAELIRIR